MSSFHVDGRISIKLEYDLAVRLAEFVLNSGVEDKQFLALAHKLARIDEEDAPAMIKPKSNYDSKFYKEERDYSKEGATSKEEENWDFKKSHPIRLRRSVNRV